MARPRKPVEVHELNGSYEKNPQRRLPPAPKSNHPIGDPPEWLDAAEAKIWSTIVFEIPDGVLTQADRSIVGILCQLLQKVQTRKITGVERNQIIAILARLGMTPADRTRVIPLTPAPDGADAFAEFA